MATEVNKIEKVFVGEYGDPIVITLVDDDGDAVDVSSYTGTITITVTSPDGLKDNDWTGSFTSDGSDGKVQATPSSGDIDRSGDWKGQVELTTGSSNAKSWIFTMVVEESLK